MTKQQIIKKTADFVRRRLDGEGTGHDWFHVQRVWQNAKLIGRHEGSDLFVTELGALLHDIADWKFYNHDHTIGAKVAGAWLKKLNVDDQTIDQVRYIVQNISYHAGANKHKMESLEGRVVQDADRLDAMGAIGIARAFAYGGFKQRPIYDPRIKPKTYRSLTEFRKSRRIHTSVNHFYEKLLLLKDKMNTKTGRKLAGKLHKFMERYLDQFYKEWEGKL
jgi:uncharacterized protein